MLDQSVAKLEEKADRIETSLLRLESNIAATLLAGARKADSSKLQLQVAEIASTGQKQTHLHKTQADIAKVKGKIGDVEARFSSFPTT